MSHGKKPDPERMNGPILPPLEFDPPSNGEYCPTGPTEVGQRRTELWRRLVEDKHKRLGLSRREFAESACGTAAWLFAINQIACGGGSGSSNGPGAGGNNGSGGRGGAGGNAGPDAASYDVSPDMMEDMARAREALSGNEFIFDVQTHVVEPESTWMGPVPSRMLDFMKLIFVESDTTVACLSGVPATRNDGLNSPRARAQLQELIGRYGGARLLFHCNAEPQKAGEADYMAQAAAAHKNIAAWKTYPQNNPRGIAADNIVSTFLRAARETGVKVIASHRGLDNSGYDSFDSPLDVVRAAKMAPDLKFLVYHAGWQSGTEAPYDPNAPAASLRSVDRFIRAMQDEGLPPNSNVYAELGTTWRNLSLSPNDAAHVIGKLLKYIGEDRVVWGTDCVMGGSPQAQIVAMRRLVIPESMQQMYGYPALTDAIKRKIFGLNGAGAYGVDPAAMRYRIQNDDIDKLRMAHRFERGSVPMPDRRLYEGPRNRREFLAFLRHEQKTGGHHGRGHG
ncbi:MAG TPA: amidohydrolase family protein [Polyangia bacterium]